MSDTFVTIDQFNEILARLGRLEHKEQYTGRHEDVYKDVEELKKEHFKVEKEISLTDTKIKASQTDLKYDINTLRIEMNEKFNTMNEKFNTTNEKISSLRLELRITLGAILAVLITIGLKLIFYS